MGLVNDIKKAAMENGTKIQNNEEADITKLFNKLFYAPKNREEEVKFVDQMFTRGTGGEERIGLHTSAIIVADSSFCYREQVLSLLYKQVQKDNVPQNLIRIFEEGNAIHEKWQRLFIRGGLGKATDMDYTRFYKKYEVSYTPDAIITIEGVKYIVEIKSVNTYQFMKMQDHPSARKQIQMYMHFSGIHNGIILCDDKNTQDFKVFTVKYDANFIKPFIARLEAIQIKKQRAKSGKMVKRCKACPNKLSNRALKCPMRDACFNIGIGRQKL